MARPWEQSLQSGTLQAMVDLNFGMVLNLQELGEHAHCGPGNLRTSGLSYDPDTFMRAGVGYYPMFWPDMEVPDLPKVLNIVQVMHGVVHTEGRRVAVHCHAGLGRTGLVIACFLVFSEGLTPTGAVARVRRGRPGALQTPDQVAFVSVFERWVAHLRCHHWPSGLSAQELKAQVLSHSVQPSLVALPDAATAVDRCRLWRVRLDTNLL